VHRGLPGSPLEYISWNTDILPPGEIIREGHVETPCRILRRIAFIVAQDQFKSSSTAAAIEPEVEPFECTPELGREIAKYFQGYIF